jgi:polyisoprenyl-teichoic acid--peptidoglycan teichoic acid transferase
MSPAPRAGRRRRIPAYQVKHRRAQAARDGAGPNGVNGAHASEHGDTLNAAERIENDASITAHPPASPTTSSQAPGPRRTDTEAFDVVDFDAQEADTHHIPEQVVEDDLASFAQLVEEAARRQKAEAGASAVATPGERSGFRRARFDGAHAHERPPGARPPRPRSGGRGGPPRGPRGRGARAGERPEPDPRPLLRRPKTWFVMVGMLFAICAIAVVLWSLNLARATYDAYNEMHVDPTPRVVYQVNPSGTAVAVPTEEVAQSLPDWSRSEPFNVLLLGVDDRDGEDEPIRSDTMIVVRVDPTAKTVTMMSIPRDVYVWIPGFRFDKINAAYPLGEYHELPGGGVALAAQTVEANFNIRIHYFITVDFTGFRKIINTIGGIIIDVPAPVKDDQYPTEDYGLTRQYFPTGLQWMDGETALRYARTRHGDNDIARGERQQALLIAIRQHAINLGLITRADDLIRDLGDTVRTDLNFNQMLALANLGRSIESENIVRVNLWEEGLIYEHWPTEEDDAFYFEADWAGVLWLVDQHFSSESSRAAPPDTTTASPVPGNSGVTGGQDSINLRVPVIVRNSTSVNLMATTATRILYNAGFSDVTPEDGIEVIPTSVIYDYAGSPQTAQYIARQLGIDESAIVYGSGGSGIIVDLGQEFAESQ